MKLLYHLNVGKSLHVDNKLLDM